MSENLDKLIEIIAKLRAPDGCKWDREQTHASLKQNFIEETYEALDAIDANDMKHLQEELGDVLFSIVNVSRFIDVDAEEALTRSTDKFIDRFKMVEKLASEKNINMKEANLSELDRLWDEAKLILDSK